MLAWCAWSMPAAGQEAHHRLSVSPDKVFDRLLQAADSRQSEQTGKALDVLSPVLAELREVFGAPLDDALSEVRAGGPDRAIPAVQRIIRMSVAVLLREAARLNDRAASTPHIRLAFAEYLVMDPDVQHRDFELSKTIKLAFRRANAEAGLHPAELVAACQEIEAALERFYP